MGFIYDCSRPRAAVVKSCGGISTANCATESRAAGRFSSDAVSVIPVMKLVHITGEPHLIVNLTTMVCSNELTGWEGLLAKYDETAQESR